MTGRLLHKIFNGGVNIFLGVCGIALLWLLLQIFCITSFHIPSDSMEPNLIAGDAILVNKLEYGARLFNVMKAVEGEQVKIKRLPGWGSVKRNDVVVFNFPCPKKWRRIEMDVMQYYVKRCVALPGDTFRIVNGRYRVVGYQHDLGNVSAQERFMKFIEEQNLPATADGVRAYPDDPSIGWTVKDFGPLYIPKAGDSIDLDNRALKLYRNVIEWEQGGELRFEDNEIYLNDRILSGYRFRKNYYFVAGDKAENSKDSRYWGLLPEEYIVGKAWRIWKSVNEMQGKTRWDRIWKKVQ